MQNAIGKDNERRINEAIANGLREVEEVTCCPYCGDIRERDASFMGCCGESSDHFVDEYRYTDDGDVATHADAKAWNEFIDSLPNPFEESND